MTASLELLRAPSQHRPARAHAGVLSQRLTGAVGLGASWWGRGGCSRLTPSPSARHRDRGKRQPVTLLVAARAPAGSLGPRATGAPWAQPGAFPE